jgi:CRP-like cAMP-binding protein
MFMEELSPWISAELGQWDSFLEGQVPRMLKKNTVLFQQADSSCFVYVVKSGRIRITSFEGDGNEKQLFIAEKGAMFGESSCLMGLPRPAAAVAIVDSQVYAAPYERLEEAMRRDFELCRRVMQMISRKNMVLLHQVMELSLADAFQRIAQVLVNLSRQYGVPEREGIRINIRFTHQDVANLIHASRVTVSNVFQVLMGEGILKKCEGRFWVVRPERLQELAEGWSIGTSSPAKK